MQYRVKTREEFIREFGKEWRALGGSRYSFVEAMDHLLGQPIKKEQASVEYGDIVVMHVTDSRAPGIEWALPPCVLVPLRKEKIEELLSKKGNSR